MLVLARRRGETLRIGIDIEITIQELGQGKVTLVVQAPGKSVRRGELREPRSVYIPYEYDSDPEIGDWISTDLPLFEYPQEVAQYLTNNQALVGRKLRWEESTNPEDIEKYRLQRIS